MAEIESKQPIMVGFSLPCVCGKKMIEGAVVLARDFTRKEQTVPLVCKECGAKYTVNLVFDISQQIKIAKEEV